MPLKGRHTYVNTHMHIFTSRTKEISRNQSHASQNVTPEGLDLLENPFRLSFIIA